MKQLNSIGARRHFFRNSRRAMRPLRPGMSPDGLEDSPEMVPNHNNGFGYFSGKLSHSLTRPQCHSRVLLPLVSNRLCACQQCIPVQH